ncbi:hypothetical protein F5B22DRAFT_653735 [Xylaria bambusicola]|uniref:uncharacterized protein n=1 Tax=Xylaria bambusicola TaxID=326684 RepID=UPI0020085AB5|nr:uncharacterized protein F5B22DRAFT_653735 [Xylaria bambusicola]KAI0520762.1 hypothetical protein F5B22DRAFT_653735 [Xylaria bambusicola]
MTFLYFFHTLIRGMPRRIITFYWITVGLTFVFWIYSTFTTIIICPHFGADSAKCTLAPNQHARSLSNDVLNVVSDIIVDTLIVTLPLVILSRSMMPHSRKISLAAMLYLSVIMVAIALIRLVGTIAKTKPNGHGSAPTWDTYWSQIEECIALMTTTIIVICAVFITKTLREHRRMEDSIWSRAGRRLLSTLRVGGSPGGSGHSGPRKSNEGRAYNSKIPQISTQALTSVTVMSPGDFVNTEGLRSNSTEDALKESGSSYHLDDLNYHSLHRVESGVSEAPR